MPGWEGKAFFRRQGFNPGGTFAPQKPKWHRLEKRETGYMNLNGEPVRAVRVTALCGYSYTYRLALFAETGPFEWRDDVKTAKLRCKNCDKAAAK